MGILQRDLEERTSNKADEIAEQRYGVPFSEVPSSLQMQTWMEAEQQAVDDLATQADAIYDRMMEKGHKPTEKGR